MGMIFSLFSRSACNVIPKDKKIIIVGAGYGGAMLGVELLKQGSDFTLIDVKESFFHNVGAVRATIEADFAEKLFIPYEKTFGDKFKQGRVVNIDISNKKVQLQNGEELTYDVLVICTGSTGLTPYKTSVDYDPNQQQLLQWCKQMQKQVSESKEFVVIGGGALGVEIAGELCTDYKGTKVTLIHPNEVLVGGHLENRGRFQQICKAKLKKHGCTLVLGERVVEGLENQGVYGPCSIKTNAGNTYHADTVFRCTGSQINSQAYEKSLSHVTNADGTLQVNEFLQVKGHKDIFAFGDCNDVKEMKVAYRTGLQLEVVKKNLNNMYYEAALESYDPGAALFAAAVSIGRNDSVGVTAGGWNVPSMMLNSFKSKDLMVAQHWKQFSQTPP